MIDDRPSAESQMFAALRSPQEIVFGSGQRAVLALKARKLGQRAFVCIDPFLRESAPVLEMCEQLREAGVQVEVFSDVVAELPVTLVSDVAAAARAFEAEFFVAIGGGSCIDLAKLAACVLTHGGKPADYYGEFRVPGPVTPLIAVPTTAGTGSEVTPVAVLTDPERATKIGISSPHLIPAIAICDPELTLTCPQSVTASAGADALAHCVEALTARRHDACAEITEERVFVGKNELTDEFARAGIRALVAGLHTAYASPDNLVARERVMFGSLMGGLAFGTAGTAAAHALQYPIGAVTRTPHGVGVGLLLPYVMAYNLAYAESELAEVARLFGAEGEDDSTLAANASRLVQDFLGAVGIPRSLDDIGFPEDQLEWALASGQAAVRLSENNPRPLNHEGIEILRAAHRGELPAINVRTPSATLGSVR